MARVVDGPLYIKDHASRGRIDDLRPTALDMIGNITFGAQIRADHPTVADWQALAEASGYRNAATRTGVYRRGPMAWAFPNRLETAMRWEPR